MKMPETIYVGVSSCDHDYIHPQEWGDPHLSLMAPKLSTGAVAENSGGHAIVGEYRFVRLVEVTVTTPAPIIEVKEVPT